jgi:hypothetical protein
MKRIRKDLIIIILTAVFLLGTSPLAGSSNIFNLVRANYPIYINQNLYQGNLPILNYEGFTYIPLREVSEILGVGIHWNQQLRQVHLTRNDQSTGNNAFRNILVSGSNGIYTVAGEARVFEATLQYEVEDGHVIFVEGFTTASQGGPEWGIFLININIPQEQLPEYGTLTLILFEISAEDGSRINEYSVTLDTL